MRRMILTAACLVITLHAAGQHFQAVVLDSTIQSSIRAISVPNDQVIWLSGNRGTILRSANGGKSFDKLPVPGQDSADFRSLYAFDDHTAVVATTAPVRIYRMTDGMHWDEVFSSPREDAFLDGISFWDDRRGVAFGDPIDGQLMLLLTEDGGDTWKELPEVVRPLMVPGEASFAASGQALQCYGANNLVIATGGVVSRVLMTDDAGDTWDSFAVPTIQGKPSQGTYAVAVNPANDSILVITGGDYLADSTFTDAAFYSSDGGVSWQQPAHPTGGLRESDFFVNDNMAIAIGPNGIDVSVSSGQSWQPLPAITGFHTGCKSRSGSRIFIAGKNQFGELIRK